MKEYLMIICLIFIILSCAGSPTDSTTDNNNNNNIALKDRAGRYTTDTLQMVLFNDGIINFIDNTEMLGAYKVGDANDTKTEFTFYGTTKWAIIFYKDNKQDKTLVVDDKNSTQTIFDTGHKILSVGGGFSEAYRIIYTIKNDGIYILYDYWLDGDTNKSPATQYDGLCKVVWTE